MRMTPDTQESIRCTVSTCSCASFKPGGVQLRSCDHCGHGWVAHALEKLQAQPPSNCGPVEVALPGLVFDLSSLILYGAEAVPVRLKILLDRLYSILTPEQVGHILHTLDWSLSDYVRGYKLQSSGKVLDQWLMVSPEEELLILKQFLRFGETRPIVELMMVQCASPEDPKNCRSNICTFVEQSAGTPGAFRNARGDSRLLADSCHFETSADRTGPVHPFESFPGGPSLLLPFHYSGSTFHCMVHPTKNLPPSTKVVQYQPKLSGTKLTEGRKQDGGHGVQQANIELAYKIKPDPDKPYLDRSLWHQNHMIQRDLKLLEVQRVLPKQETTSSFPPMKSTLNPSSSFYPSISSSSPSSSPSSPLKPTQKWKGSSSSPIHPLPPISSSFLCPLPSLSSSSSLLPLPSSLCSLSSSTSAGSRKGRVCCGVCGKSFYDKGTLKIHYNAVHLKIKHRCTVAGCTMVFSSLRSRNRHSANPNPRLHTSTSRDSYSYRNSHSDSYTVMQTHKDTHVRKHTHDTPSHMCSDIQEEQQSYNRHWQQNGDAAQQHMRHINAVGNGLNTQRILKHCRLHDTPPHAYSPPASLHSTPQSPTTDSYSNASFRSSQQAPPPPPPPPFLPADTTPPLGSPAPFTSTVEVPPKQSPHLLVLHPNQPSPQSIPGHSPNATEISSNQEMGDNDAAKGDVCTTSLKSQKNQWESGDTVPKKKPRKSSMPVKIEREKVDGRENEEEEFF